MNDFISDLRYAARMLAKSPGFTAIAVFALALGIGANTSIFSVVNAVLLRPLPFDGAERLMAVESTDTRRAGEFAASYPDFHDLRASNKTFESLVAYHDDSWALTGPGREAKNLRVSIVSANMFGMLGVRPLMGRTFNAGEDENTSAPPTVVLSHVNWRKNFGGDPNIIGKAILLRAKPYTVIGVMPPGFNFPVRTEPFEAWTTFAFSGDLKSADGSTSMGSQRGAHFLDMTGKLKPGVTPDTAKADLNVISAGLAAKYPESDKHRGAAVRPLLDKMVANLRPVLLLLLGAVGCVLLVACANVANLLLARASSRHREIAIRAALGAGRLRVIRQVLTESVLLSLLGGAAGLLLGLWGSDLLVRFSPESVPRVGESRIDFGVFLFALGVSLLTGIVFGLVPAYRASQADPAESLKEGARGTTEGIRSNKARSLLVISEVALALMLLACAGLLIRSLDRLNRDNPGFRTHNVLTASFTLPDIRFPDAKIGPFVDELERRLGRLPGVTAVSDVVILPMSGSDMSTGLEVDGHPLPVPERGNTRINIAGLHYFPTLDIPLLAGRDFQVSDSEKAAPVVVVNEAFVKKFFPNENPIGKRVRPGFGHGEGEPPMREIVGVVASVEQDRIGQKPLPELFMPFAQFPESSITLVIRTASDAQTAESGLRSTLRGMDPDIALDETRTMDARVSRSLAQPRFQGVLLLIFAGVALTLTAVGLYGVISYSVAQRTHEIGTRMALGAQQGNILKLVVGQGLLLTSIGVAVGLLGAIAVSQLLTSLLYEVAPTDPLTLVCVAAVVLLVAVLATLVPAYRAANVDPMVALRYE